MAACVLDLMNEGKGRKEMIVVVALATIWSLNEGEKEKNLER